MVEAVSMDKNIPEGYELSDSQYFGDLETAINFLDASCQNCKKSECELERVLKLGMGNNYPVWHESFIALRDPENWDSRTYGIKVVCKEYDEDPEKIANYTPRQPTKIIYIYPDPDTEWQGENGQRRITSKKWDD